MHGGFVFLLLLAMVMGFAMGVVLVFANKKKHKPVTATIAIMNITAFLQMLVNDASVTWS